MNDQQASDAHLLIASVTEPHVYGTLVRRWSDPLMAYFYRRTFDPEVSLDLVAETLAVGFERRSRYRDTGAPASAWVFGNPGELGAALPRSTRTWGNRGR